MVDCHFDFMQTVSWYMRRLRAMSGGEVVWRVRSAVRDRFDRYRIAFRLYPNALDETPLYPQSPPVSRWSPVPIGQWRTIGGTGTVAAGWRDRLLTRADAIVNHRFSFFDLENVDVGRPVQWNREHANGIDMPTTFAAAIDYRDYASVGDAKVGWEPNRHHELVVLARAYRATGRVEYAEAIAELLESWLDQCPFGYGMNWRSPLEVAVRLVNWVWTLDLAAEASPFTVPMQRRLLHAVRLHLWEIARKYSRGSSANNHLIGEAAGVYIATRYFRQLPESAGLCRQAREILHRQILAQTYATGASREQAFGYHLFVLQFFMYAAMAGRWSGDEFDRAYWDRLERMFDFVDVISLAGPPPAYGDADDGYVLNLGNDPRDVDALRSVQRVLFPQSNADGGGNSELSYWLFGAPRATPEAACGRSLESRRFEDAGYYLLQWGQSDAADRVAVLFDCGDLGFTTLAAHGHADALSFTVRAFGVDVFIDPGTYDYFTFPEWRRYFRGTRAHNTITVDGEDQSVMLGAFLWGRQAAPRLLAWQATSSGGSVAGEHDGYRRLQDPVICRRCLSLDRESRMLTIDDEIAADGVHHIEVRFHLSHRCAVQQAGCNIAIRLPEGSVDLLVDDRLQLDIVNGGSAEEGGWTSDGYHRKLRAWTVIGRMRTTGTIRLRHKVLFHAPVAVEPQR